MGNDELLASLRLALAQECRLIVQVIVGLIDVEERRVHLESACSSMFEFCVRKLGMSEGEAFRRLTVARLAKRFPALLVAIRDRRLHLSSIVLLRELFTESNVDTLVAEASGKTKRAVQELVAKYAPRPDAPSTIRKMPQRHVVSPPVMETAENGSAVVNPPTAATAAAAEAAGTASVAKAAEAVGAASVAGAAGLARAAGAASVAGAAGLARAAGTASVARDTGLARGAGAASVERDAALAAGAAGAGSVAGAQAASGSPTFAISPPTLRRASAIAVSAQLVPLSEERHKVQFTASTALRKKLERAQSLSRHSNPTGDLADVVEKALDLLIAKLERAKLGAAAKPRSNAPARESSPPPPPPPPPPASPSPFVSRSLSASSSPTPALSASPSLSASSSPTPALSASPSALVSSSESVSSSRSLSRSKGGVSRAARREVVQRDEGRCAFLSSSGERCGSTDFLEIDHLHPRALGGGNGSANLRLLCRAHNRHAAEQVFGAATVARKIEARRLEARRRRASSANEREASGAPVVVATETSTSRTV